MGFKIFTTCLRQFFSNIKIAIQLSWLWIVLFVALSLFSTPLAIKDGDLNISGFVTLTFLMIILFSIGGISIAVGWHRYILREETPPLFHFINFKWPLGSYFWQSLKIVLVFMLILFVFSFFTASMLSLIAAFPAVGAAVILITLNLLITWLLLRFGLILPAAAIGEPMTLGQSFEETNGYGVQLLITALLLTLLYSLPNLILTPVTELPAPGSFGTIQQSNPTTVVTEIIKGIFSWVSLFVGVGILTVLYGHICEKRPI